MNWIAWDDTLVTGDAGMDAEHKELSGMLMLLRDAVESGSDKSACAGALDDILRHAKTHFELEQRLMTQHRYPRTEQHAAEHAMLMRQALDFRKGFDADADAATSALVNFADVWLSYHILFSDKDLAAFLVRAGANHEKH